MVSQCLYNGSCKFVFNFHNTTQDGIYNTRYTSVEFVELQVIDITDVHHLPCGVEASDARINNIEVTLQPQDMT